MKIDSVRDIVLERQFAAPPALIWRCWTEPALFCRWYLPRPWALAEAIMDLRPGGRLALRPEGAEGAMIEGSFLEVVPLRKLVFTDLFGEDFAPFEVPDSRFGPNFTAVIEFWPQGGGTHQRLVARHRSADEAAANRAGGFEAGWATICDQLEELTRTP